MHLILCAVLYLTLIRNILKAKHIKGAHVITRGIPLTRGPTTRDERLRTLGQENSEARSERRRPDYNRLSCIQTVRGGRGCVRKGGTICFPYQGSAYETELVNTLTLIKISSRRKGGQIVKEQQRRKEN